MAVDRAFGKAAMRLPSVAANDFAMVFFLIRGSKFINCKMKCRELQTSVVAELEDFQNHQHTEENCLQPYHIRTNLFGFGEKAQKRNRERK